MMAANRDIIRCWLQRDKSDIFDSYASVIIMMRNRAGAAATTLTSMLTVITLRRTTANPHKADAAAVCQAV